MTTLTLRSVKCIKPSTGTSPWVTEIVSLIAGVAGGVTGGVVAAVATGATGGALVGAVGVAAVGGAAGGSALAVQVINGLDKVFSGGDDLYLKVHGQKVWPSGKKYEVIQSQETKTLGLEYTLDRHVKIELWEHDVISADDAMGYLDVPPEHDTGLFRYVVAHAGEGSVYEIEFKVA